MEPAYVVIPLLVVALGALLPAFRFLNSAVACSRTTTGRAVVLLAGILLTSVLAAGFLYLPFFLAQGKEVDEFQLLVDLALFSLFPLGVIALVGYAADHMAGADRPAKPLLAGCALVALAALPTLFFFFSDRLQREFEIEVIREANRNNTVNIDQGQASPAESLDGETQADDKTSESDNAPLTEPESSSENE